MMNKFNRKVKVFKESLSPEIKARGEKESCNSGNAKFKPGKNPFKKS